MLTFKRLLLTGSALALATFVVHCGSGSSTNPTPDMKPAMDLSPGMDLSPFDPPSLSGISPTSAPNSGGAQLTLSGAGFQTGTTVTVGGVDCATPIVTATQITCTVPPSTGHCGPAAVVVTNPDQQSATQATGFSYRTSTVQFGDFATLSAGTAPRRVISADFNKDGRLDIATVNGTTGNVSVFLQNSAGTFANKVDYTTGAAAADLVAADVTGDGNLDIVAVNALTVSVLVGSANGSFASAANSTPTGLLAGTAIAAGDFDGDAKIDLVVVGSGSTAYVLKNSGTGTFVNMPTASLTTAGTPGDVEVGDLDGDGKLDIFVTNTTTNNVSYFKNTSTGGSTAFATKVDTATTGTKPIGIVAVDIDGDGHLDVVTANNTSNNIALLKGNGTALATGTVLPTANTPESVFVADINNDGILDILVAAPATSSSWSYLQGMGNSAFANKVDTVSGNTSSNIIAADLDKDGLVDIAYNNSGTNNAKVFKQVCN